MKIFNREVAIPSYIDKHQKAHEIAMLLLTFVIVPLASILLITLACNTVVDLRPINTSVSTLMWYQKKFAEVGIWGVINLALYIYLLKVNLDAQQYSKPAKIIFYVLFGLSAVLLIGGISVPLPENYLENKLIHTIHNDLVTTGFVLLIFVTVVFIVSTPFRNGKQGMIMIALLVFFIMTLGWAIPSVNQPHAHVFITAATQMYILAMMHIMFTLNYFFAKLMPNTKFAKLESEQSANEPTSNK